MFDSNTRAQRFVLGTLLCVAAVAVSACAHSQAAPPADSASPRGDEAWHGSHMRHRDGRHGDRMFEGLNLSKEQRTQVNVIRDRYRLQADSIRKSDVPHDSASRVETRAAFRSMMTQELSEIRSVLTSDQQKKFDEKVAKMRERQEKHGGHGDRDDHDGHDGPPNNSGGNPPAPPPA